MKKRNTKFQRTKLESLEIQWIGKKIGNRILGCQSTNHAICKGELWECERCHKIVCWEEGSTDLPDVCDDCWFETRKSDPEYAYLVDPDFKFWLVKKDDQLNMDNEIDPNVNLDVDDEWNTNGEI